MERAAALHKAWRDGGKDEFRRLAAGGQDGDPFVVLANLLQQSRDRANPLTADDRAMIAAYGEDDAAGPLAPGLAKAVRAWLEAPSTALDDEDRLTAAFHAAKVGASGPKEEAARLGAIDQRAMADPLSIQAPLVRLTRAARLLSSGALDDARAAASAVRDDAVARGWPVLEADALDLLAEERERARDFAQALVSRRRETTIRATSGPRFALGDASLALAEDAANQGLANESLASARAAASAYGLAGQALAVLRARHRAVSSLMRLGRHADAAVEARVLRTDAARHPAPGLELGAAALLAAALLELGRFGEALAVCDEALTSPAATAARYPEWLRSVRDARATTLWYIGAYDEARAEFEALLSLAEVRGMERAHCLRGIAGVERGCGRTAVARRHLEESIPLLEAAGVTSRLAEAEAQLSTVCVHLDDAKNALSWAERSVGRSRAPGIERSLTRALLARGEARLLGGDAAGAMRDFDESLALANDPARASRGLTTAVRSSRAYGLLAIGRPAEAVDELRAIAETLLATPSGLADTESAGRREILENVTRRGTDAAYLLARLEPAQAESAAASALWFQEAGRARGLVEALATRASRPAARVPADLLTEEREALVAVARARRRLVEASPTPGRGGSLAESLGTVEAAYGRLRAVDARIAHAAAPVAPDSSHVTDLATMRTRIADDTAVVTYSLSGKRAYALVVSRETARLVSLGPPAEIRRMAGAWLELGSAPDGPEATLSERLYAILLAPLEKELFSKRRLVVIPDDLLATLPFDALSRRDGATAERVVERWEVSFLPSVTVLDWLEKDVAARPPRKGVVALGDPVYPSEAVGAAGPDRLGAGALAGLARLPRSGDEARGVAALDPGADTTLLVREQATLSEFLAAATASPRRALHIACHAFVDDQRARLSGLVFGQGEVLDAETLARTRLDADLAVLSACTTAGGVYERGEGMIGLTRAFFMAGVRRVVVSSWRVADDSTAQFMLEFHGRMATRNERPGEALRAVKLARLHAGGPSAHPYRWAGFTLWGPP